MRERGLNTYESVDMFREELDLSVEKYLFQLYKITSSKVNRHIKILENIYRKNVRIDKLDRDINRILCPDLITVT